MACCYCGLLEHPDLKGREFLPGMNHSCWKYENDPGMRKICDERTAPAVVNVPAQDPAEQPPQEPRSDPCIYRGEETGQRIECPTCEGKVRVKVFGCEKHGHCTVGKHVGMACCATCPDYATRPSGWGLVAPLGTRRYNPSHWGAPGKKVWEYPVTVAIPHLNTPDLLPTILGLYRAQTVAPYLVVVDTGSAPETCALLEQLRAPDCEIHYLKSHAYHHSSEPVAVALDVAHALCRTEHLFHTHADCFPMRRDLLETLTERCLGGRSVVGYRMSPRDWLTEEWQWMVGHTCLMLWMPVMRRCGVSWSFERLRDRYEWRTNLNGTTGNPNWIDTEVGFNYCLREEHLHPVFLGEDTNDARQTTEHYDHVRSYSSARIYGSARKEELERAMALALVAAKERLAAWAVPSPKITMPALPVRTGESLTPVER